MIALVCAVGAIIVLDLALLALVMLSRMHGLVSIEEDPDPCTCRDCYDWDAAERQMSGD